MRNKKAGSEKNLPCILEVKDAQPAPKLDAEQFLCLLVVHDKLVAARNLCFEGVRQLICNVFQFVPRSIRRIGVNEPVLLLIDPELARVSLPCQFDFLNCSTTNALITHIVVIVQDTHIVRQIDSACLEDTNTVLSMATYVNEYTVDMLPDKPLIENTPNMWSWWPKPISPKYTTEFLKDTLHHRRRTLPANGALLQFDACQLIQEIKLKETCRDNEIVCLYKIVTKFGDLAGYYNTSTEWFYILTDRAQFPELVDSVTNLILWLYTSLTCDLPDVLPTDASFRSSFVTHADAPFGIRCLMIGGKPRDYRKKGNGDDEPLRVFDKSKYDASSKNINGFIRHLPAGQKASERAILIAESYGYELKSDETYVTPFVRRQWLKKKTEE